MKLIITFITSILISSYSFYQLEGINSQNKSYKKEQEVLYLPNGIGIRSLSFGYTNFVADVLWFKTVNYFGKHFKSDKDYTWLSHMCELVTDLDNKADHVFDFCANMLAWEANKPQKSFNILTKNINSNPKRWRSYYLRGFISMYFLNNSQKAQDDFITGATLPGAPPFLARLAAKKISMHDPIAALGFLSDAIKRAKDPMEKEVLKSKFKEIQNNALKRKEAQ